MNTVLGGRRCDGRTRGHSLTRKRVSLRACSPLHLWPTQYRAHFGCFYRAEYTLRDALTPTPDVAFELPTKTELLPAEHISGRRLVNSAGWWIALPSVVHSLLNTGSGSRAVLPFLGWFLDTVTVLVGLPAMMLVRVRLQITVWTLLPGYRHIYRTVHYLHTGCAGCGYRQVRVT